MYVKGQFGPCLPVSLLTWPRLQCPHASIASPSLSSESCGELGGHEPPKLGASRAKGRTPPPRPWHGRFAALEASASVRLRFQVELLGAPSLCTEISRELGRLIYIEIANSSAMQYQ